MFCLFSIFLQLGIFHVLYFQILKFKFVETQFSWVGNKHLTVVIFLLVVLNLYDQLQSVENSAALHFRHAVAPSCFMFMYLTLLRRDPSVNTETSATFPSEIWKKLHKNVSFLRNVLQLWSFL